MNLANEAGMRGVRRSVIVKLGLAHWELASCGGWERGRTYK